MIPYTDLPLDGRELTEARAGRTIEAIKLYRARRRRLGLPSELMACRATVDAAAPLGTP